MLMLTNGMVSVPLRAAFETARRTYHAGRGRAIRPGPGGDRDTGDPGESRLRIRRLPDVECRAMAELANDFSWSKSRNGVFDECKRRYFYQYYGSWGGWDATAPAEVRRLYVLKQLASRQMWAGRVVHDAIEMALFAIRDGRGVPVDGFVGDVIDRMRTEWPRGSGRMIEFPEVDRCAWFDAATAKSKMNPAQAELVDRLEAALVPKDAGS